MKAFIFAAGKGTRLYPLTEDRPKAMVALQGKPMIAWLLDKLRAAGFTQFVVNVHHKAEVLVEFLKEKQAEGFDIRISDETGALLNTGGGLKHAADLLAGEEPFLIHNVDVLTNIDTNALMRQHQEAPNTLVTMALRDRETSRYLLWNSAGELRGWENRKTGERILVRPGEAEELTPLAFSGIMVMEGKVPALLDGSGSFPIVPALLKLAEENTLKGYRHDADTWLDLGTPERLRKAEEILAEQPDLLP